MAIKTHKDLRAAARKAIDLFEKFHWKEEEYSIYGTDTPTQWRKVESAWRNFCRALDRVVYAAGGHRDGCTWHLLGAVITAETLWNSDSQDTWMVEQFLISQDDRHTAHAKLRIAALWANRDAPLPRPEERAGLDLPAVRGEVLQSILEEQERAKEEQNRQHFQAMWATIGTIRAMDRGESRDQAQAAAEQAYKIRFEGDRVWVCA